MPTLKLFNSNITIKRDDEFILNPDIIMVLKYYEQYKKHKLHEITNYINFEKENILIERELKDLMKKLLKEFDITNTKYNINLFFKLLRRKIEFLRQQTVSKFSSNNDKEKQRHNYFKIWLEECQEYSNINYNPSKSKGK
jgi:hypothetical protein